METFVLTQVVQHVHEYKQHIGAEKPASNDTDISIDPEEQARQYRQHLDRLLGQAQRVNDSATVSNEDSQQQPGED